MFKKVMTTLCALTLLVGDKAHASHPKRQSLRVWVTGYYLRGKTASGLFAGPGRVAVDPLVFPLLHTRFWIPGYGSAVAADTGRGVHGLHIDLWFPTRSQCLAATGYRTIQVYR